MATDQNRSDEGAMTPEQLARVEAIRARRRMPDSRAADHAIRETSGREYAETGTVATVGDKVAMEDVIAFRRFVMDLRKRREGRGLSLDDVAVRSGIDKAALSRLESGKQPNPTVGTLMRYARAIELPIGWLAGPPTIEYVDSEDLVPPIEGTAVPPMLVPTVRNRRRGAG